MKTIIKEKKAKNEFGQELRYIQREKGQQADQFVNQQASITQPFTYTGYQRDSVANTYYAQTREYKPEVGRFIGEDRIKGHVMQPYTLNQYAYCKNQPMSLVDLDGLTATRPENAGMGASGGTLTIVSHPAHSWIVYTDVETGVTTSIGTWGNEEPIGVHYNLELDATLQGGYEGNVSLTGTISSEQAKDLWEFIDANNSWGYLNNCANFAAKAWESAGQKKLSQHSWVFGIPLSGSLARSISKMDGYQTNKNFEEGCDTEGNDARSSSNFSSSSFDSSASSGAVSGGENSSWSSAGSSYGSGSY